MTRRRLHLVRAVRRLGPEPSAKQMEGHARLTLYPAKQRTVKAVPQDSAQVAYDILAESMKQPKR